MKPTLKHLLALPLALAVMGGLGCDSSSSYGDKDTNTNKPQAEIETEDQTPGWVTDAAVTKADITVTGMT